MVAETNYIYLALLVIVQYLGLNHTAYDVSINLSKQGPSGTKSITVDFEKVNDKENDWVVVLAEDGKNTAIMMTIEKNIVTDFERGEKHEFSFENVDFSRLEKTTDTIYNKENKVIATINNDLEKGTIIFSVMDKSQFDTVVMKYK